MRTRIVMCAMLGWLATSCATAPPPVPVSGSSADLSQLAGEWNGEYHGVAGGRQGIILFKLAAGADTAFGEVVMFPRERSYDASRSRERGAGPTPPTPQEINIGFVRTTGGMVSGRLEPYQDPDCGCMVTTVFEGRMRGDSIEGRYLSYRTGNPDPIKGEWKARRKRP